MSLPVEKQFYVQGGPVLESAEALVKALEEKVIPKDSFDFHLKNGDFSKWIDEVLDIVLTRQPIPWEKDDDTDKVPAKKSRTKKSAVKAH